jgi:predicted GIY-YIG superfamily endonuclease
MRNLLIKSWAWVTLPPSINNKSYVGLMRTSSNIIIWLTLVVGFTLHWVLLDLEGDSVLNIVSELGVYQHSLPPLIIPCFLTQHTGLGSRKNIDKMRYLYSNAAIIYGIVCETSNEIYVGSTWDSVRRYNKHFLSKDISRKNKELQAAINKYGIENFTAYIFTKVTIDRSLTKEQKKLILRSVEQQYIDMFPKNQVFNPIRSMKRPLTHTRL